MLVKSTDKSGLLGWNFRCLPRRFRTSGALCPRCYPRRWKASIGRLGGQAPSTFLGKHPSPTTSRYCFLGRSPRKPEIKHPKHPTPKGSAPVFQNWGAALSGGFTTHSAGPAWASWMSLGVGDGERKGFPKATIFCGFHEIYPSTLGMKMVIWWLQPVKTGKWWEMGIGSSQFGTRLDPQNWLRLVFWPHVLYFSIPGFSNLPYPENNRGSFVSKIIFLIFNHVFFFWISRLILFSNISIQLSMSLSIELWNIWVWVKTLVP